MSYLALFLFLDLSPQIIFIWWVPRFFFPSYTLVWGVSKFRFSNCNGPDSTIKQSRIWDHKFQYYAHLLLKIVFLSIIYLLAQLFFYTEMKTFWYWKSFWKGGLSSLSFVIWSGEPVVDIWLVLVFYFFFFFNLNIILLNHLRRYHYQKQRPLQRKCS